ncbi:MAG: DNA polymerase I, partial [Gammaproteobacteria bacterium]|nr:DNA polymerase I [Gammaproteobacteria bacterium]
MSDKPYNLILVDGSSYLYRAFHALPPLTNSKGAPTGAVYGVLNMIKKLLTDYNPDYVAIVFDAKGKSFRHDIYSDYKANRPTMPLELQSQVGPLYELIQAMGLPLLVIDKVEADDVIATLAVAAETAGLKTLISTGDKDIAQLVNDNIHLINTMSNKLLDTVAVKDKFAVMPEQIVDYLALVGDSSDNIPGVPKVGPKTAAKWLAEYGTVAEIIKHADEVKGKVGENLRASLEQLPMAQKLATLDLKVALDLIPEELIQRAPDNKKLIELLQQMEFKKWLLEVLQLEQANNISNANYQTILTAAEFDVWLEKLTASASFAFDTETTALDTIEAEIVGVSFAVDSDSAAYVPLAHDYDDAPAQLDRDFVLTKLKPLLEDPDKIKIGQNLKYDMEVLVKYDIHMQGVGFDTMLESYVLDSTASRHDLDSLALKYLGRGTIKFSDVAGSGKKQLTFNQVPIEQAAPYAAEDAAVALQLHQELWSRLTQEPTLVKVLQEIEIPLVPVLARLELNGVMIDAEFLRAESVKLGKRIQELTDDTYKIAGTVFNLASPKQLQEILFEKLKLPVQKKTPGGQPSTAEGVLQTLALDYPLPKLIL